MLCNKRMGKGLTDQEILAILGDVPAVDEKKEDVKGIATVPEGWNLADPGIVKTKVEAIVKAAGIPLNIKVVDPKEHTISIQFIAMKTLVSETIVQKIEGLGIVFRDPIPIKKAK